MVSGSKAARLETLRTRIAALEARGPGMTAQASAPVPAGVSGEGRPFVFTPPPGVLHEVWADTPLHAGAALGFSLGQALQLAAPARPAVLWLQLGHDAQETGLVYAPGLAAFGADPDRLVMGRLARMTDLLWAIEEAVACPAVAAVIAETGGHHADLDFTATRRLGLRAHTGGASVLLVRTGRGREASAARFRWHVAPAPSAAKAFDARAPGAARWQVRLEKGMRHGRYKEGADELMLEWTKDGFAIAAGGDARPDKAGSAALHGAAFPALGHRLPETA